MNNIFSRGFIFMLLICAAISLHAQEFSGLEANRLVEGANKVWIKDGAQTPSYIGFAHGKEIPEAVVEEWIRKVFGYDEQFGFQTINEEIDYRGDLHRRVKLTYLGVPLFDAMLVLHFRNQQMYSINGDVPSVFTVNNSILLSESTALSFALQHIGAVRYKWQMNEEEALLKAQSDNPSATYYPAGRMMLYRTNNTMDYHYAWVFNVYADQPLYRADVFVDATDGAILFEHNLIHVTDVLGTAVTKYSSTQTITTDSTGINYRLRETGRGNGVETFNMQKGTNYGSAVDFTDADNYWNNVNANKDEVATDAHWATEATYDYFMTKFNRNSINNQGFKLISYVHYDNNYANAFWNGQYMTYGDGNGTSMGPLTAMDITAHEITHGLTSFTADLIYQNESGALNEAFSDIFGSAVEWFAKPSMANWLIGENIGTSIRSMSNPNSKGLPDTYLGQYWYTGTGDNGGVHYNNGPLCYWFYLLSVGGSGTNDNGHPFNVTSISIDSAAAIAFRMLTVYLTNSSQYVDARYYAILSAIDLFGPCSQQVASTTNGMRAIGLGSPYVPGVISDFSAPMTEFCTTPATVTFNNFSNNGLSYLWDFGNGQTSTAINPSHTYTAMGTYTVTLIVSGGSCGADTLVKTNYISIDQDNACVFNMPQSNTVTNTNCDGFLFDSGGSQNYQNNTNGIFIIAPSGAMSVTLNFQSFNFEDGYDYLYVYDGTGITAPLIGKYDGSVLPNGGTITSTTGSITLRQTSDAGVTESGFLLGWNCNYPTAAPVANFIVSDTLTCDGLVTFMDISTNGPSNWFWDLGDGSTAYTKVVTHTYMQSGIFTVKLITSNSFGGDTIIKHGIVKVEIPSPSVASKALCNSGTVTLANADTTSLIHWYDSPTAQTPMHTGSSYTTPNLTQSTTYWVEEVVEKQEHSGAKPSNSGGGSYFTASVKHYLVFEVFKASILKSVVVYAGAAGNRTIELQNSSGTVLKTITAALTNGINTVTLNFELQPGTGYRLVGPASPNLYRNDGGISYPYQISNLVSITHSSASTNPTGYYYFFYLWKVHELPCLSPRTPVEVIVSQLPPVADFTFTKLDPVVTFSDNTTNKGMNTWDFGDGITGYGQNPVHPYGALGTYQVQLTVDNGCGLDQITKPVVIESMSVPELPVSGMLRVYPNPSSGRFMIRIPEGIQPNRLKLTMHDMAGRAYQPKIDLIDDQTIVIQSADVSPGIYLITLIGDDKIHRARVNIHP